MLRYVLLLLFLFLCCLHHSHSFRATTTHLSKRIQERCTSFSSIRQYSSSRLHTLIRLHESNNNNNDDDPNNILLTTAQEQNDNERLPTTVVVPKESSSVSKQVVPTYQRLFVFASTTMLIWLSEPLLSLVDTTVVGMTQGHQAVVQLAALGPATTLFDSLLYLTYFLAIATTNLISQQLATRNYRQLQRTTSHVLGVATVLGFLTQLVVLLLGQPLLKSMAGASGTTELLFFAFRYTWIRALASVSSVVGMVAQSFCLATLDTKTPAYAVLAASTINLVGDWALAPWGVQGAAVATATSSVASTMILMKAVRTKLQFWRQQEILSGTVINGSNHNMPLEQRQTNHNVSQYNVADEVATDERDKDDIANVTQIPNEIPTEPSPPEIPLLSLPDTQSMIDLIKLSGPIFFVILAKIACYGAMTLRCTDFGVVALASHSVMMRVFFFYGCFGDSVSQTAQTFLPATLYPQIVRKDFRKILQRLLVIALGIGVLNSQLSIWILRNLGGYLTQDMRIITMMKDHAHWLGAALFLHPLILMCEGTVIAARDFGTLVTTYVATLGLHFGILKFFCGSFPAVWRCFFLFQSIRLVNFSWRVWRKQRAIKKEETARVNTAN